METKCAESEQGIFEQVLHGDLDFSSDPWPSISEEAKDLVRGMLVRDPKKRLSAHEVLCELFQMLPSMFYCLEEFESGTNGFYFEKFLFFPSQT